MRLLTLFLILFFGYLTQNSLAQRSPISTDSMNVLLDNTYDAYYDYEYKKALDFGAQLIDEATFSKDHYFLYRGYERLAAIHSIINDTTKGRFYSKKSLDEAFLTEQDTLIAIGYSDLGTMYSANIEDYEKSISYYRKSIDVIKNAGEDEYYNLVPLMNIAWTYLDVKDHEKAYPYLLKVKELSSIKEEHPLLYLNLDILFARYHFYSNQDQSRVIQLFSDAAISAEKQNYLEQASQSNEYLARAYEKESNYRSMATSLKKQMDFDQRIHESEKEAGLLEAGAKHEVEQYQNDLKTAENEKLISLELADKRKLLSNIFIISSIVLLFGLIGFSFLYRSRRKFVTQLRHKNEELTEAKEKAEKLSKLKTQFFSTVSHELRTPLYGVIGISSILLEDKELTSHKEDLTSLKFSADYLLALINDVLLLNKMDADGVKLQRVPFKLDRLLHSITRSFAFGLEQNNNTLILNIDPEIPERLVGDSVRLSQILMNLVGNAVKFNENGSIWVKIDLLEQTPGGLFKTQFTIEDDGIGIPEDKQQSIFEEFSQVENKNYNYQGTGLGLPIVKKLLALFNSEIALESAVGKGAKFTFSIDLEANELSPLENDRSSDMETISPIGSISENIHVLVVDDNKINQKITHKILESKNFRCSLAHSGEEAVEQAKSAEYDLILMDIHMPGMGGIEATKIIRKFDVTTPIVALTAVEIEEMRNQILESGMNDIILKPYDVSQFLNTLLRNLNGIYMNEDS